MALRLRVEDGILLKEYVRPWKPGAWGKPPKGWTADEDSEWVHARSEEMMAEARAKSLMTSREFTLRAAAVEYGKVLREAKKPWPGWVPVGTLDNDRDIRKAYRALFIRMNADKEEVVRDDIIYKINNAEYPPDGDYVLEAGVMREVGENDGTDE